LNECATAAELQTCSPDDVPRTREGIRAYFEQMRPQLRGSEIAVQAIAADGAFHVSVRDTGPGIAAEDQQRVFEEFQQVDSSSTTTPFYDETNQAWRDASSVTIYDAPTAYDSIVQRELTAGATAVVSRAHFHAYLVRDFSAIYHVEIEIVFTFGPRGAHQTARNVLATGTVTSLPAPLRSALVTGYPAYAYLR